jgi:predicted CoA-binding protein
MASLLYLNGRRFLKPIMQTKKTLVLGASENPRRYSYLAVENLVSHNHPVLAIGKKAGHVQGVDISTEKTPHTDVDTVTLYLNPANQKQYYDYILSLNPKRIIFNPGTENRELASLAKNNGIETLQACTLVMLSTGQY